MIFASLQEWVIMIKDEQEYKLTIQDMKLKIVGLKVDANKYFMIKGVVLAAHFLITSRRIICLS